MKSKPFNLIFSDRYHKMKLLISILFATVVSKTLLEEIQDVFADGEEKDVLYSNGKLSDSHLLRIFPNKLKIFFF